MRLQFINLIKCKVDKIIFRFDFSNFDSLMNKLKTNILKMDAMNLDKKENQQTELKKELPKKMWGNKNSQQ